MERREVVAWLVFIFIFLLLLQQRQGKISKTLAMLLLDMRFRVLNQLHFVAKDTGAVCRSAFFSLIAPQSRVSQVCTEIALHFSCLQFPFLVFQRNLLRRQVKVRASVTVSK